MIIIIIIIICIYYQVSVRWKMEGEQSDVQWSESRIIQLPAVDEHGSHVWHLGGGGPADKGEDGQSVLRDTHVWPLGVMVLEHCTLTLGPRLWVPLSTLNGRVKRKEEMLLHYLTNILPTNLYKQCIIERELSKVIAHYWRDNKVTVSDHCSCKLKETLILLTSWGLSWLLTCFSLSLYNNKHTITCPMTCASTAASQQGVAVLLCVCRLTQSKRVKKTLSFEPLCVQLPVLCSGVVFYFWVPVCTFRCRTLFTGDIQAVWVVLLLIQIKDFPNLLHIKICHQVNSFINSAFLQ